MHHPVIVSGMVRLLTCSCRKACTLLLLLRDHNFIPDLLSRVSFRASRCIEMIVKRCNEAWETRIGQ